jgi:hypothetical protein
MPGSLAACTAKHCQGRIADDPATLKEIQQWMIDHLLGFKDVFGPRLPSLVAAP